MGITSEHQIRLECDHCNLYYSNSSIWGGRTYGEAIDKAKKYGWTIDFHADQATCPKCAKKKGKSK